MDVLCAPASCCTATLEALLCWPGLDRELAETWRCREAMRPSLLASSFSSSSKLAALVFNGRRASTCRTAVVSCTVSEDSRIRSGVMQQLCATYTRVPLRTHSHAQHHDTGPLRRSSLTQRDYVIYGDNQNGSLLRGSL